MTDYNVDTFSVRGNIDDVLSELKDKINDIDSTKVIRDLRVVNEGSSFRGIIIFDA